MTEEKELPNLGWRVRDLLEAHGHRGKWLLARIPELSQQTLSQLIRRNSKTSEHAVAIADAFGVSVRWLLTGVGDMHATDWPFPRVERARWDACGAEDRGYVQASMNRALDECEAARSGNEVAA